MSKSTLRQKIQSATKKIVLNEDIPQTMGFNPQPDYRRGTMGDLSKSFTPEKKTSEAAGGDFLDLAKVIEAKFGDIFSDDLKSIYDGLKNVWSHIRPPEGKPSYSLGHSSQEGADEVLFTFSKEINEEIASFKNFLASQGFDKISNAIDIVSSYLGKLRNKVSEFENILTSSFEEPPDVGFKLENLIKDLKLRKLIREEISQTYSSGIGEIIFSRIVNNVPSDISQHLIPRLRAIENEEELIETMSDFLDIANTPQEFSLQFEPEEWGADIFQSLSDYLDEKATEKLHKPSEDWGQW